MKRRRINPSQSVLSNIDQALTALDAEDLRDLIRDIIPRLEDKILSRFADAIIERAADGRIGWRPSGPTDEDVVAALAFAEAPLRSCRIPGRRLRCRR